MKFILKLPINNERKKKRERNANFHLIESEN